MLSEETKEVFLRGIQHNISRSFSDVGVYLDGGSKEERKFYPFTMVFPYPSSIFDENSVDGSYVLNQAISGFVKMINDFVSDFHTEPVNIAAIGLHEEVELIDNPPFYEAVCGDVIDGYEKMAILIWVRFVLEEMKLVPYSFGLTNTRNVDLDYIDHQLNKPSFNPED